MVTLSIAGRLYVLEQTGSGFVPAAIVNLDDPFLLENTEEVFHHGVVITVAGTAHAAEQKNSG